MNNYEYKNLRPFCRFVLENFPFIEYDFDALTPWKMWCALGSEINKIINSQNQVGEEVERLSNAFNALQSYVENYFENLDVQDEINNKLDEMAESGELQEIISEYLNSKAIFGFDTVSDMIEGENLINGSYAQTMGYYSKNDGGEGLYKIRTRTVEDIIDNGTLIALEDTSILAELIIKNDTINVKQMGAKGDNETDDTTAIQNAINYFVENEIKGIIFFPTGKYIVDNLTIPKGVSGLTFKGINQSNFGTYPCSIIAKNDSIYNDLINIGGYDGSSLVINDFVKSIKFDNILINCNNRTNGVHLRECTQINFKDSRILNYSGSALKMRTVFDSIFDDVYLNSNGVGTAVQFEQSNINNSNACRFINCDFESNLKSFEFVNCNQIMISNTKIETSPILVKSTGMINFVNCLFTPASYSVSNDHYIKFNGINKTQLKIVGSSFDCGGYGEDGAMIIDSSGVQGGAIIDCNLNNINSLYNSIKLNNRFLFKNNSVSITKKTSTEINSMSINTKCNVKDNVFFFSGYATGSLMNLTGNFNNIIDNEFTDDYITGTNASRVYNMSTYNRNKISPLTVNSINNTTGVIDVLESHDFTISHDIVSISNGNSGDVIHLYNNSSSNYVIPASLVFNSSSDVSIPQSTVVSLLNKNGNWYKM